MQSRVGPNRAGPQGFLVWIADGIKMITKEDIVPKDSDRALFRLAPYLVFVGVSATFVVMPFGHATPLVTYVDEDLLQYDVVWAAAGTPKAVFSVAPAMLRDAMELVTQST